MGKENDSTLEKKKWYLNTKAMLGLITGLVAAVVALTQFWNLINPNEFTKAQNNILIVLDKSAAMAEPFDSSTKFEVAKNTLLKKSLIKVGKNDNLALRLFGGTCFSEESSELAVEFGQNNKGAVQKKIEKINDLEGETTLVSAVIDATSDFHPPERFADVNKKIVIIAGRFDTCPGASVQDIHDRIASMPKDTIQLDIQVIGMKVPREDRQPFNEVAKATNGKAYFVRTREELELLFDQPELSSNYFKAKRLYDETKDAEAEPLFKEVAEAGVSEAMLYLGKMYSDSLGVLKDYKKAIDWLNKGSEAGNAEASTLLGVMYANGQGVTRDPKKSILLFEKAAKAGDAEAMYNLGLMHDYGRGVDNEDDVTAQDWYKKAANLGHEQAQERLKEISQAL